MNRRRRGLDRTIRTLTDGTQSFPPRFSESMVNGLAVVMLPTPALSQIEAWRNSDLDVPASHSGSALVDVVRADGADRGGFASFESEPPSNAKAYLHSGHTFFCGHHRRIGHRRGNLSSRSSCCMNHRICANSRASAWISVANFPTNSKTPAHRHSGFYGNASAGASTIRKTHPASSKIILSTRLLARLNRRPAQLIENGCRQAWKWRSAA